MSPATGTPISSTPSTMGDDPRALARRALSLAVRSSPMWSGAVFEVIELSRLHPHEFDNDSIESAIALVTTFTRPGPVIDETIQLLVGLRETTHCLQRVQEVDDTNAAPPITDASPPQRPILNIVMIEGRGIWIELTGALIERGCDVVAARLTQLSGLDFSVAVVDVRRISALDAVGIASILQFAQPIIETGGTVHIIDPDEHLRAVIDPRHCGIIHTAEPPNGNWWG